MQQTSTHPDDAAPVASSFTIPYLDRWTASRWFDPVLAVMIVVVSVAFAVSMTATEPGSWNDISRVAAIQARIEQGTWSLDNSPWQDATQDRVELNDRSFSGKMPLLSGIGAVEYYFLYQYAGLSLAPDCATVGQGCAYYWLSLTLVGVPFALMLGLFYLWARHLEFSWAVALLGTVAIGVGTQLFPYSLVLNHHVPAAVGIFVSFFAITVLAPRDARWLLISGVAAAYAAMSDPLAGAFTAGLFALAVYRHRMLAWYFVAGALPPVLVTAWLDLQITGTLLPPYVIPAAYMDRAAGPELGFAGAGTPDDLPQYAFKMFLGAQGLFAYNSILLFGIAGIVVTAFRRTEPLRAEAIAIGLSTLVVVGYVVFRTGNLGGVAYGERYLITIVPGLMAFLFFAIPRRRNWTLAVFGGLFAFALAFSIISSFQGAPSAWKYVQPPFQLTRDSQTGRIGAKWNLRW